MRLALAFCHSTCAISHTHTPERTNSCSQTNTPVHTRPWAGAYRADCRNEWSLCGMSDLWVGCEADTLLYLPVRPTEACLLSAASVRLYLLRGILGISATQGLLLPFLSTLLTHTHKNTHTHTTHTLFIQRHGGWPSFTHREERQQRWDTGKKSPEDLQTRVSVWGPTAAEVGLFLELWGIHPVNLHNWNATRVST